MVREMQKPKNTLRLNVALLVLSVALLFLYVLAATTPAAAVGEVKQMSKYGAGLQEENARLTSQVATRELQLNDPAYQQGAGFASRADPIYLKGSSLTLNR